MRRIASFSLLALTILSCATQRGGKTIHRLDGTRISIDAASKLARETLAAQHVTCTPFGPAFFKEGHGDGAHNYMICFERLQACEIVLTNSDNGKLAFRPLLEGMLGDTVTPWAWEGYTAACITISRKSGN